MLRPDSPEEQKLDVILNFAKLNPQPTYKINFPQKLSMGKNVHFSTSITTYKLTLGWDILLHWSTRKMSLEQANPRAQENTKDSGVRLLTFRFLIILCRRCNVAHCLWNTWV